MESYVTACLFHLLLSVSLGVGTKFKEEPKPGVLQLHIRSIVWLYLLGTLLRPRIWHRRNGNLVVFIGQNYCPEIINWVLSVVNWYSSCPSPNLELYSTLLLAFFDAIFWTEMILDLHISLTPVIGLGLGSGLGLCTQYTLSFFRVHYIDSTCIAATFVGVILPCSVKALWGLCRSLS